MTTPADAGVLRLDEPELWMRRAADHMRQHHGTADPMQSFYAELASFLDRAAQRDDIPLGEDTLARRLARRYCRGAGIMTD
jgi:hypothetical protein